MFPIRKILHPTDFSELSRAAFELACSLARDHSAELFICHVAPPPIVAAGEVVLEFPASATEQLAAELDQVNPTEPGVRVTHRLLQGDPATEIVRLAAEAKADLIVMGTHGRGGLGRLLMGSVAEQVMRKAPCPVVTAKAPLADVRTQEPAAAVAGSDADTWIA
jgi:nucleotide-binding universal stress UspA family protein